jgi:hypothetical protein
MEQSQKRNTRTMSAKQEAFRMFMSMRTEICLLHDSELLKDKIAKQCALIAVEQMILVLPFTNTNSTLNEYAINLQKYLEQVKKEIQLL